MMKMICKLYEKNGSNTFIKLYMLLFLRTSAKIIKWLKLCGANIGEGCEIKTNVNGFPEPYMIRIGKNVYVASGCKFLTHDGAFSFMTRRLGIRKERTDKLGLITIGDNCFIGFSATFIPNVTVGNNCIIGAGAVVTKDVPDNSVIGGNPAHVICSVEDYLERNKNLKDYTCGWSIKDKRKYYEQKYADNLN